MAVQFENPLQSLQRLPQVIRSIPDVIREPAANPVVAAVLLGIVLVVLAIILLSVGLIVMRPRPEREEPHPEDEPHPEEAEGEGGDEGEGAIVAVSAKRPMSWLTVVSIMVITIGVLWAITGVTTSSADVCASCHTNSSHSAAPASDPHRKVSCVSCHESGGLIARATVNLATRVQHVILGRNNTGLATGYGRPTASDACASCHRGQINGVFYDKAYGVRMSHKEPLAAGAQCVDCHALKSGVIGAATVGMAPCLRCHDGKVAKAECATCHVGDPATAIRSTAATESLAAAQVPNPQCGGCHTDMTKCDACHGIRMPHTLEFEAYGHARPAAIQIWATGSAKTCVKCHYAGHNSCQGFGCHSAPFPSHPTTWRTLHQQSPWSKAETACSCHNWNPHDHNGMTYCQVCHPTKPANAVP